MSHSPGPWRNFNGSIWSKAPEALVWNGEKRSNMVATISDKWKMPDSEKEANAQLIASAPDMLKALRKAAPWLAKLIADDGHKNCAMANDAVNTLRLVEDVIRQAEGN